MPAGQSLSIVACADSTPAGGAFLANDAALGDICPAGKTLYVVPSYVPFAESGIYIDGLMGQFDASTAGGFFGFGFGLVVFFYVLGLKGSVLMKPFWSSWR
jgi:hypothetical protein